MKSVGRFRNRRKCKPIKAVARLGRLRFTGFLAWVVWLVFHIWILIGFRNRLVVLINWAWDYMLYDRAVRLITKPESANAAKSAARR